MNRYGDKDAYASHFLAELPFPGLVIWIVESIRVGRKSFYYSCYILARSPWDCLQFVDALTEISVDEVDTSPLYSDEDFIWLSFRKGDFIELVGNGICQWATVR